MLQTYTHTKRNKTQDSVFKSSKELTTLNASSSDVICSIKKRLTVKSQPFYMIMEWEMHWKLHGLNVMGWYNDHYTVVCYIILLHQNTASVKCNRWQDKSGDRIFSTSDGEIQECNRVLFRPCHATCLHSLHVWKLNPIFRSFMQ